MATARIAGFAYDGAQTTLSVRGRTIAGVQDVTVKFSQDRSSVNQMGSQGPVGLTLGTGKFEGSMTMLASSAEDFILELSRCGVVTSEVFDLLIMVKQAQQCGGGGLSLAGGRRISQYKFYPVTIKSWEAAPKVGTEATMTKFDLEILGGEMVIGAGQKTIEFFPGSSWTASSGL